MKRWLIGLAVLGASCSSKEKVTQRPGMRVDGITRTVTFIEHKVDLSLCEDVTIIVNDGFHFINIVKGGGLKFDGIKSNEMTVSCTVREEKKDEKTNN